MLYMRSRTGPSAGVKHKLRVPADNKNWEVIGSTHWSQAKCSHPLNRTEEDGRFVPFSFCSQLED